MTVGLEQRERLREAFGTFVDPDLTERILEEGTNLAVDEVEVSLLFMDIRGFTTYAERADAREVVARLNDLYGAVVPVILEHGGHANKFIGDAVNTAARVESATRQTDDDVLITGATKAMLRDDLGNWVECEQVTLKGKTEDVRLFASQPLREAAAAR
jgi:class 3 adenylate cyclase